MDPASHRFLYALRQRTQALFGKVQWQLRPHDVAEDPWLGELEDYLKRQFDVSEAETVRARVNDFEYWVHRLETDLYADLAALCPAKQDLLARCGIGFVALVQANAFAMPTPQTSGRFAIGVHLGLVWVNFLLAEALLTASSGEQQAALEIYQRALQGYQKDQFRTALAHWWSVTREGSVPEAAHAAAVGTVALRFNALHEFGHICLGHVDTAKMIADHNGHVHYVEAVTIGLPHVHALEFAADQFALQCMIDHRKSNETMWNNLLFINAQFRFLQHAHGAGASATHPSYSDRIAALTTELQRQIGPAPNDAPLWAEQCMVEWRNASA